MLDLVVYFWLASSQYINDCRWFSCMIDDDVACLYFSATYSILWERITVSPLRLISCRDFLHYWEFAIKNLANKRGKRSDLQLFTQEPTEPMYFFAVVFIPPPPATMAVFGSYLSSLN